MNKISTLIWADYFLEFLQANLSKEDFEALEALVNKAHENRLKKLGLMPTDE